MKKLLVLLVVLGFVTASSASVVGAVIDLQVAGGAKEITIGPSDTINLEIIFTGSATENLFNLGVVFTGIQGATLGDLNTGLVYNSMFDPTMKEIKPGIINIPANITLGFGPVGTGAPLVVVSGITLHCDLAPNMFTIKLVDYVAGAPVIVVDSTGTELAHSFGSGVLVHQTPEPMTMMLLGLGSLFLVRRKK